MKVLPMTKENVEYVIDNLDELCQKEIDVFGENVQQTKERFISMIGKPFTGAFYNHDGNCCAVGYLESIGFNRWRSHFVARQGGLKRIARGLTDFFSRFSDGIVKAKGYVEILSGSDDAWKWFFLMGFTCEGTDGVIQKYVKR